MHPMTNFATPHFTVSDIIAGHAARNPESPALVAPNRTSLTYGRLRAQAEYVVRELNRMGIGRGDRVAVVLNNGPELAAACMTVSAAAASAPLNPQYRESECDFYLKDLSAKALVVQKGNDCPARTAAQNSGIPIIELIPQIDQEAGVFSLDGPAGPAPKWRGFTQPEDTALVLHTSGTTSRPKRVPLSQANLCASADHIRRSLQLTPADRCLNVMPLFHIHGLIGATLSSLAAGASVVCSPGYDAGQFFAWLQAFRPTWYTAVPTIHQSILAQAAQVRETLAHTSLRLIRSSSSALSPLVMRDLERTFHVPVLEAYGMTEASHQMCSNPLLAGKQKPGSVGLPAGPEVAIMSEDGQMLGPHMTGEIVIRGANVMAGYEGDAAANKAAFRNGWFRTGDQGYRDTEGYFFITGRIKELINRGGEKIAPREVDEVLLEHPAVAQAVTFAVPHVRLGEDVAAAAVLRSGASTTEAELRQFALERLATHKVPSQVVFLDRIPQGPTGKLQRIGLHQTLAPFLQKDFVSPASPVEEVMTRIWGDVLGLARVGTRDNFFMLGGDSLLATRVASRVRSILEIEFPLETMFQRPTIAEQAIVIEDRVLQLMEQMPHAAAG